MYKDKIFDHVIVLNYAMDFCFCFVFIFIFIAIMPWTK
jgi:hypothetical protein